MARLVRPAMYAGVAGAVVGLSKVHARYVADPPYDYTGSTRFAWSLTYVALLVLTAYGAGLPELPRTKRSAVVTAFAAAGAGALGISLVQLFVGDALLPRFVVFGAALLLVPWYMVCTAISTGGRLRAESRAGLLFVGGAAETELLREDLALSPELPANIVATLSVEEARSKGDRSRPLCERAIEARASLVVLDRDAQGDESIVGQAAALHEAGIRIRTLSLFYEQWLGKLPMSELERVSLFFDIGEVHRARYGRVKRVLDLALAMMAAPLLLLAVPLVWIGDLVANRGPLLYRQPRVGKNGKTFNIVKFRTMRPHAGGALVNEWTQLDDPRITPFGRILRVTHVDELPQVLNILRGDLSIVGPRPEQPHYVADLVGKLPFYNLRHLVRPGMTGWAQVKYGYASDERDALEKLQYEFWYLRHQSLSLDLRIVGRTARSIIRAGGR